MPLHTPRCTWALLILITSTCAAASVSSSSLLSKAGCCQPAAGSPLSLILPMLDPFPLHAWVGERGTYGTAPTPGGAWWGNGIGRQWEVG